MANTSILMKGPTAPNAGSQAWSYIGIPYPTDPVPSAIMPTLPTGATFTNHEWIGTYDPCTIAVPSHASVAPNWPSAEQSNCYYIDKNHGSATDTANPFGFPNQPRLTIPTTFGDASMLYAKIVGNNSTYAANVPDYFFPGNINNGQDVVTTGTSTTPKFVVGVNSPRIGKQMNLTCKHIIFDGLYLQDAAATTDDWGTLSVLGGAHYNCFRNGGIRGDGVATTDIGSCCGIAGAEPASDDSQRVLFFVLYNNVIRDLGNYQSGLGEADIHVFRPATSARWCWCVNNTITNYQGDAVQNGPSNGVDSWDSSVHYIYFVGNIVSKAYENGVDNKNSCHVFAAYNTFSEINTGFGQPTCIVLSNNDEGLYSRYHWAFCNTFSQSSPAIRFSGDQSNEFDAAFNNLIKSDGGGIRIAGFSNSQGVVGTEIAVNNTIVNVTSTGAIDAGSGSSGLTVRLSGNITYDCVDPHASVPGNAGSTSELSNHLAYESNLDTPVLNEGSFDVATNNSISDPLFTNPGSGIFTLQSGSPAIDKMSTRDSVYTTFSDLYGISAAFDLNGNAIPATNVDAGCYQRI